VGVLLSQLGCSIRVLAVQVVVHSMVHGKRVGVHDSRAKVKYLQGELE
jgi:hypothetical protein